MPSASPQEQPQGFDPYRDDCVYVRYDWSRKEWHGHVRRDGRFGRSYAIANYKQGPRTLIESDRAVPPGTPYFYMIKAHDWEKTMDAMRFDMTYEEAVS